MHPCMGVVGFRTQFYRLKAASYMWARTKASATPGSVFDNFLLLYVHMLLVALAYMLAN